MNDSDKAYWLRWHDILTGAKCLLSKWLIIMKNYTFSLPFFFSVTLNCQSLCNLLQTSRSQLFRAATRGSFGSNAEGIVSSPVVMEMWCQSLNAHMMLAFCSCLYKWMWHLLWLYHYSSTWECSSFTRFFNRDKHLELSVAEVPHDVFEAGGFNRLHSACVCLEQR